MTHDIRGTLLAPASSRITREQLRDLPQPPVLGPVHRPVHHADLADSIESVLADNGLSVTESEFATGGRDHARLFGIMKVKPAHFDHALATVDAQDSAYCLGIISGNDKSVAVRISIARSVLVCTNLCISGSIALSKRHTSRLDLRGSLQDGVGRWIEKQVDMTQLIEKAKDLTLTPDQARLRIFKAFETKLLATRYFPAVVRNFFQPEQAWTDITEHKNSLWSLHNSFSRALRLAPAQARVISTTKLAGLLRPDWPDTN